MNPFLKRKNFLGQMGKALNLKDRSTEKVKVEQRFTCKQCGSISSRAALKQSLDVCPNCGHHYAMKAKDRILSLVDEGTFRELNRGMVSDDPLKFPEYKELLLESQKNTGMKEAVITGTGRIDGHRTVLCVMDPRFVMASMGVAVGEKITRAFEYAAKKKMPVIIVSASGGARMQEGILSLMQMAKTSAAAAKLDEAGQLFISVMTYPTTGGVTASFASLGDITLAEPGALIGFAGKRVIEQTIGEKLPENFQSAEFQMEHGFVDSVVPRGELRSTLSLLLDLHRERKRRENNVE